VFNGVGEQHEIHLFSSVDNVKFLQTIFGYLFYLVPVGKFAVNVVEWFFGFVTIWVDERGEARKK
jgi:hypothetical protein